MRGRGEEEEKELSFPRTSPLLYAQYGARVGVLGGGPWLVTAVFLAPPLPRGVKREEHRCMHACLEASAGRSQLHRETRK